MEVGMDVLLTANPPLVIMFSLVKMLSSGRLNTKQFVVSYFSADVKCEAMTNVIGEL